MAEIEVEAFAQQCWKGRVADEARLSPQVAALAAAPNMLKLKLTGNSLATKRVLLSAFLF
jgi:hypothetical protein